MNIIGIIAEYNPFHNGHLYQINKIQEMYPNSIIIAIISTCFTQRGDISIINKWNKTRICLESNIDLVIELPTIYATQSADMFAYGAINILNKFKIDTLIFGSETNDIKTLKLLANTQINNQEYDDLVKKYLESGSNYPTAMSKALFEITKIKIDKPNDLLALSYIKEIIKNNFHINPISIKRTNDYHSKTIDSSIISATLIREIYYQNKDLTKYIPSTTNKYLESHLSSYFNYLKYKIITDKDNLSKFLDVDEGIDHRVIKYINSCNTLDELINKIKTKRYTQNRINRMLLHILLGIKKSDNNKDIYLRILGFNTKGRNYLNSIKKKIDMPIYANYKPHKSKILDIELTSTSIYSLLINDNSLIEQEYKNKPIIK